MKRDQLLRELDDDQSGWISFFSELWLHQHSVGGRTPYLPSPSEIRWRCEELRWLERCGFCRAFIVNIMEHENPCIERVKQMVARHGPAETYRRCVEFLLPTEYDQEKFLGANNHDWNRRMRDDDQRRRVQEAESEGGGEEG